MSGLMSASAGEGEVVPVRPPGAADRAAAKGALANPESLAQYERLAEVR